jgi:2,4-dienoyl-CoA reductase-like NADH-dependent reductase (Old Yellow Enzyme family)/thioredoxin reductase
MKYKHLFSEGKIGDLKIKNRIVMPAMGTALASSSGEVTERLIRYYEARAKGGAGLIITEITSVDDEVGKAAPVQLSAADIRFVPMMQRLADVIHKYDTKIFMQLHHAGRQTRSIYLGGRQIVAPSPVMCKVTREQPRELSTQEVKEVVGKFVAAAFRCKMAGMDGVELHCAHGYLLNAFMSPYTNKRTDEYGGSFENRMRVVTEIVKGIKQSCGKDFPVIARISADEFVSGGIDLETGQKIARHLEEVGVDAIDVSNGIYETMVTIIEPSPFKQGWKLHLAETVKKSVGIPVIAVSAIREPQFAEQILSAGKVDFVALGRAHLADPEWGNKALEGRDNEIRKCIACLHCIGEVNNLRFIKCAINARTGREAEFDGFEKSGGGRKVVVVGGGPAGMEAARVLAKRNFKVVLFEKEEKLGGQLNIASKAPGKEVIDWVTEYLEGELKRLNVDVRLKEEANVEKIRAEEPYAVFVATGAKPIVPDIEGVNGDNVCLAEDVLSGRIKIENETVAVIGGGMTGCETAELLASAGNRVFLAEMLPKVATGVEMITKFYLTDKLKKLNVEILASYMLERVSSGKVVLRDIVNRKEITRPVDRVVLALGVKPENKILGPIKDNFKIVRVIGDASAPGKIHDAIRQGFEKAYVL